MAIWVATFFFTDVRDGSTTKSFVGDFADYAAADAAYTALETDVVAATDAAVSGTLCEDRGTAQTVQAGANVFLRVSATVQITGKDKENFKWPSPVASIQAGNSLNPAATAWTNLIDNFAPASNWRISDGDSIDSTVSGKIIFAASGKTNLPA